MTRYSIDQITAICASSRPKDHEKILEQAESIVPIQASFAMWYLGEHLRARFEKDDELAEFYAANLQQTLEQWDERPWDSN